MKKKRLIAVGLAIAMVFAMAACGSNEKAEDTTDKEAAQEEGKEGYFLGYSVGDYKVILQAET